MEDELRKNLALNIRLERVKKRLTQEKLAELSNISPKHITKIENEGVMPSVYLVYKIALALNVTVDKLLQNVD